MEANPERFRDGSIINRMIPLQKVAFKLDISATSGGNSESAG